MRRATRKQRRNGGASLVEFALIIPIMFLFIVATVNFAGFFFAFITVGNASRAGVDYWMMSTASYPGAGVSTAFTQPGAATVASMLSKEGGGLPNSTSLEVRVCTLNPSSADISNRACNDCTVSGGTMTCTAGTDGSFTSKNPAPDTTTGEGDNYTMAWTDIAYTYNTFFPVFPLTSGGSANPFGSSTLLRRQSISRLLQ